MESVRQLRTMRGMNQVDLARASGVAQNTISEIELGKREARPGTLKKLADALNVEISELLGVDFPKAQAPQLEAARAKEPEDGRRNWRREAEEFIAENRSLLQAEKLSKSIGYLLLQRALDRWWDAHEARHAADDDEQFPLMELNEIALAEEMYGDFQEEVYKELKRRFPDKKSQDELEEQRKKKRRGAA